ncbi:hypothetical protein CRYUN_Cryun08bG0158700 [Craigia yunnanensis]
MAPLSKKTIQHFTHCHPLTEVSANTEFLCNGCRTLGFGTRYRCEPCDFDLHDHCAICPMEIELSSFMHGHGSQTCRSQATGSAPERPIILCGCKDRCLVGAWSAKIHARLGIIDLHHHQLRFFFFYARYAYGYGAIPLPPYFAHAWGPLAPPYFGPYAHGYGIPSSSGEYNVNIQHSNSSQVQGNGGRVGKKMYAIAGNLALGVLNNMVFGTLFS